MSELSITKGSAAVLLSPVPIPNTEPERYISFYQALNLRFPDEDTGDWHFQGAFFERTKGEPGQRVMPLSGKGQAIDTTPSLGQQGVREMSAILHKQGILVPPGRRVYVANHYRAIADLAMLDLQKAQQPSSATNREINSWLDTAEQVEHLRCDYLEHLAIQLSGEPLKIFKQWIMTVKFD
ncbi:MAG: hypothetical protein HC768_22685 [Acaryochloris sp. CRU_2_0]|nr:hypothetical protein [Acaryochloris sp. CRU_2_0]